MRKSRGIESYFSKVKLISYYILAGGMSAFMYFLVFIMLVDFRGSSIIMSCLIAYSISAAVNYSMNYYLTFSAPDLHRNTIKRYAGMLLISGMVNAMFMHMAYELVEFHYLLIQAVSAMLVFGLNFLMSKFWVYRR